jgi:hypothetical protein
MTNRGKKRRQPVRRGVFSSACRQRGQGGSHRVLHGKGRRRPRASNALPIVARASAKAAGVPCGRRRKAPRGASRACTARRGQAKIKRGDCGCFLKSSTLESPAAGHRRAGARQHACVRGSTAHCVACFTNPRFPATSGANRFLFRCLEEIKNEISRDHGCALCRGSVVRRVGRAGGG